MNLKILIAGRGGEGIIFLTRVLAEGAWRQGIPVISTETHGMAQRGGSVISQLKLGEFMSPMISFREADLLIATSEKEAERVKGYLRPGGLMVVNSKKKAPLHVDALPLAQKIGNPRGANVILLGFALAFLKGLNLQPFVEAIEVLSPSQWAGKNKEAFLLGLSTAKEIQQG